MGKEKWSVNGKEMGVNRGKNSWDLKCDWLVGGREIVGG